MTATDIVKRLVSPIENSNKNVTTDNWYTNIPLLHYLLEKKTTLLGTMKKNKREIPPKFLPTTARQPGESMFGFQKDKVLVSFVPKRNKAVILVSSMHDSGDMDEATKIPEIILDYNMTKGRTPFQPSEDTDALLSELPPLSHNVVHAADPSQIRKDGSRRVPDQGYRRGVEELPTPSLQLLPM